MRRLLVLYGAAVSLAVSETAKAQAVAPAGMTRRAARRAVVTDTTRRSASYIGHALVGRVLFGELGLIGGALAGLSVAAGTGPHHCNCDDPGLDEAVTGFVVGGAIGSALGATFPDFGDRCSFGARFVRAAVGSVAGMAIVAVASKPWVKTYPTVVGTVIGSAPGASLALIRC